MDFKDNDERTICFLLVLTVIVACVLYAAAARAQCITGAEGFVPQEGTAETVKEVNPGCAHGSVFTMTCLSPTAVAKMKAKRTELKARIAASDKLCAVRVKAKVSTAVAKGAMDLEDCEVACEEKIEIIHESIKEVEGADGMGWVKPLVVYAGSAAAIATGIVLILKGEVDAVEKIGWTTTGAGFGTAGGFTVAVW